MSNIKPIDAVMWAVVAPKGIILHHSILSTKRGCINCFSQRVEMSWDELEQKGYTCQQVRVRIEPINTTNNG